MTQGVGSNPALDEVFPIFITPMTCVYETSGPAFQSSRDSLRGAYWVSIQGIPQSRLQSTNSVTVLAQFAFNVCL